MGFTYLGELTTVPQFRYWHEYVALILLLSHLLVFLLLIGKSFQSSLPIRFRWPLILLLVCSTVANLIQICHWYTPGHPILHWFAIMFGALLYALAIICNLEILKTFSILTKRITIPAIEKAQKIFVILFLLLHVPTISLVAFLPPSHPPPIVRNMYGTVYPSYMASVLLYDTWQSSFIATLLLRHVKKLKERESRKSESIEGEILRPSTPSRHRPSSSDASQIHGSYRMITILACTFLINYLSLALWLYSWNLSNSPFDTSIQIISNNLGIWQPVCYYFFFQSIKLVQFHSDRARSKQKLSSQPLRRVVELRSVPHAQPEDTKIL
jgi:hypothetical protein